MNTTTPENPEAGLDSRDAFEARLYRTCYERVAEQLEQAQMELSRLRVENEALRRRHDERERFLAAVERSRPWRAIQSARSIIGRKW